MASFRGIRKNFFLLIAAGFIILVALLGCMLLLESAPSMDLSPELRQEQLSSLESRIVVLERDIHHNHELMKEIHQVFRQMGQKNLPALPDESKVLPPRENVVENAVIIAKPMVDQGMCYLVQEEAKAPDVQMLQVYDSLPFDNPNGGVWTQGWDITYEESSFKNQKLLVFVVPHSHNDPGWIKTFERYYADQTRQILNSMVEKLSENSRMKFIWAEISYFDLWWSEIDDNKRQQCLKLIKNGQLEIVTGGWVMNDEANAHYYAMVDQMIEGHQYVKNQLDYTPKHGWSIDPFGYSPTMAYLLKQMGLDSMLIQRVHYSVKKHLAKNKQLEFMWRQTWDHDEKTDMFCHTMPFYSYDVPHTCGPDPKVCCQFDFLRIPGGRVTCPWRIEPQPIHDGNVQERASTLLDQYRKKAQLYRNNVLLVPLGDDFRYESAGEWDKQMQNYQKLFDTMNNQPGSNVEAKFATLGDYFGALYERAGSQPGGVVKDYPSLSGDFFTYADKEDNYWSGYYTSRPFFKRMDRTVESQLRAAEIAFSVARSRAKSQWGAEADAFTKLVKARRNLGIFQHHDGITGTSKDHVMLDYGSKLQNALDWSNEVMRASLGFVLRKDTADASFFEPDGKVVQLSQAKERFVVFYNSLGLKRQQTVRVRVSSANAEVRCPKGDVVQSQTNPVWKGEQEISSDSFELVFVVDVAPFGLSRYSLKEATTNKLHSIASVILLGGTKESPAGPFKVSRPASRDDFVMKNDLIEVRFSGTTGMVQGVQDRQTNKLHPMKMQLVSYGARQGTQDRSGAYLFLPNGPATAVEYAPPVMRIVRGKLLSETHVMVPLCEHQVSVYHSMGPEASAIEVRNRVDIRPQTNFELALRFKTEVDNKDFFTDLNGFQIIRRRTYSKIPLQGNVYPMTSMAFIEDNTHRFSLLSAQSLGVASLNKGWLEIFLDRRLNQDDNRGVGQGVQDNQVTPSKFLILLESIKTLTDKPTPIQPAAFPSLTAHAMSQLAVHRLFSFSLAAAQSSESTPAKVSLLGPPPCDHFVVNLRSMQKKSSPNTFEVDKSTALVVHRLGYDCRFPLAPGLECPNTKEVHMRTLLGDSFTPSSVKKTSLSLLHDKGSLDLDASLGLHPMELTSFQIQL